MRISSRTRIPMRSRGIAIRSRMRPGRTLRRQNWLALGNIFRRYALGSYIGATGSTPRPYGMYVQTFHDGVAVDPGEAQIRWQQFVGWTMGYKFVDAFIYRGGNNNFGGQPNGPVYQAFQETARQGRNLGPALSKLISYGYGPSFVQGAGSSGFPASGSTFDRNNAQPSQRYLTGVSNVTNLGTKNGGLVGRCVCWVFQSAASEFRRSDGHHVFHGDERAGRRSHAAERSERQHGDCGRRRGSR